MTDDTVSESVVFVYDFGEFFDSPTEDHRCATQTHLNYPEDGALVEWNTMQESEPIRIPKAAAIVANRLRRSIVHRQFKDHGALPNETELMAQYHVSRSVVREALRILESESLIEIKRGAGGGARVRHPHIGIAARPTALLLQLEGVTLQDLFEARATLEPAAVRRIATLRPPGAIERLRQLHAKEVAVTGDPDAYSHAATLFHEEIIELAQNKTLAVIGRLIVDIVDTHHRMTLIAFNGQSSNIACEAVDRWHRPLIDMIEAGRVDDAVQHWENHLKRAGELALQGLGPTTVVDIIDRTH